MAKEPGVKGRIILYETSAGQKALCRVAGDACATEETCARKPLREVAQPAEAPLFDAPAPHDV